MEGNLGYRAHAPGETPGRQSITLLEPRLIEELNRNIVSRNKRWIVHRSALYGPSDLLASYLNSSGKLIKQINLNRYFDHDDVRIIKTLTTEDATYLFITSGHSNFGNIKGFSLKAIKTDPQTGEISEIIHYL